MRRGSRGKWLLPGMLILAASCGGGKKSAAPAGPQRAPGGTAVIGLIGEPDTMNPLFATSANAKDIYERIFLKLVDEQDDFLSFQPLLARSWEYGEDGRSITFHLRTDVRWYDGAPTTARDVRFTWQLEMHPEVPFVRRSSKERIRDVEVVDDSTVTFHFTNAYSPVYQLMDANDGSPILPRHVLEKIPPSELGEHEFSRRPMGNGPYRLERWDSQESLVLVRNPDYFDAPRPYLDRVIWRVVPDQSTLLVMLENGEIDVMEAVPPKEARRLMDEEGPVEIRSYLSRSYSYIAWNARHEPFDDPEIRRALTMAIDRRGILDALYFGFAEPLDSPIHPLLWAHKEDIERIPYDPDRARRVLAEKGWKDDDGDGWVEKNGRPFAFALVTNRENQIRRDMQVMVQAQLKEVGIRVRPEELEWTVLLERFKKRDFEAAIGGWRAATKVDMTQIWHSSSVGPDGFNRVFYMNPVADSLNDAAKNMLDPEEALPLWHRWQEIVYRDQPYTFLGVSYALVGINRRVRDARPTAMSVFQNVHEWWIPESERKYPPLAQPAGSPR
jgi:peptide/nickel transport system substrate-binding protein